MNNAAATATIFATRSYVEGDPVWVLRSDSGLALSALRHNLDAGRGWDHQRTGGGANETLVCRVRTGGSNHRVERALLLRAERLGVALAFGTLLRPSEPRIHDTIPAPPPAGCEGAVAS